MIHVDDAVLTRDGKFVAFDVPLDAVQALQGTGPQIQCPLQTEVATESCACMYVSGPHTVHYCTLHCTHYSKFWSALSTQCTVNLAHLSALSTECCRPNRYSALSALDFIST